nr:recombinase family protein [Trueperella pyogenes]
MLALARKGAIDLILTKSISRFARNTVDLLETVRELKDLGWRCDSKKRTSPQPALTENSCSPCWRLSRRQNQSKSAKT